MKIWQGEKTGRKFSKDIFHGNSPEKKLGRKFIKAIFHGILPGKKPGEDLLSNHSFKEKACAFLSSSLGKKLGKVNLTLKIIAFEALQKGGEK